MHNTNRNGGRTSAQEILLNRAKHNKIAIKHGIKIRVKMIKPNVANGVKQAEVKFLTTVTLPKQAKHNMA